MLKYLAQILCSFAFSNIQKRILRNRSKIFCLFPFQIGKKRILTNLKIPGTVFLLIPFLKY